MYGEYSMAILLFLSVIACFGTITTAVILAVGIRKMGLLGDITPDAVDGPTLSIIVPACNEEKNIEKGLLSLLDQDYHDLEIIVVNDRYTDNTASVLQTMKKRHPRLRVHHVSELPRGWMGKSHALSKGAEAATGEYLVFTDADVLMEKTVIARAVEHVTRNRLDHLTLIFKNVSGGWLLNSLVLDAGMGLMYLFRPWAARNRKGRAFVGIGAFNMVKKQVYEQVGGHNSIRMHPIDDMMLGKTIKKNKFRQDCLLAYDFLTVPWYESVGAMVDGLQKNLFAVVHYRLTLAPFAVAGVVVGTILPAWGLVFGDAIVRMVCLATVLIRLLVFIKGLQLQNLPLEYAPGALITPYISCYIIVRSALVTVVQRGIIWRGRHYPLKELKKSEPLFF